MSPDQIEHYAAGGQRLSLAVRGLTPADMAVKSEPGKWSVHQVVIHLCDAEAVLADRAKRVIAMDDPPLLAFDHDAYLLTQFYDEQSAEDAVATVDLLRRQTARVLRKLPAAAWDRAGTHDQAGRKTLTDIIVGADRHLDHHLKVIAEKRERVGKLMW